MAGPRLFFQRAFGNSRFSQRCSMAFKNGTIRKQLNCRIDARLICSIREYAHESGVPLGVFVEIVLQDLDGKISDGNRPFADRLRRWRKHRQRQRGRECP